MHHKVKYAQNEKIKIWLDLCDFSLKLMKSALSSSGFKKRIIRMRKEHQEDNRRFLVAMGRLAK